MLKRVKRRYLAVELESEGFLNSQEFMDAVWAAVVKLYGEHGTSRTGLTLIDYDAERRFAVIRTMLVTVDMVRAALASMTKIGGKPLAVHVLTVSGTIKGAYRNIN